MQQSLVSTTGSLRDLILETQANVELQCYKSALHGMLLALQVETEERLMEKASCSCSSLIPSYIKLWPKVSTHGLHQTVEGIAGLKGLVPCFKAREMCRCCSCESKSSESVSRASPAP